MEYFDPTKEFYILITVQSNNLRLMKEIREFDCRKFKIKSEPEVWYFIKTGFHDTYTCIKESAFDPIEEVSVHTSEEIFVRFGVEL